MNVQIPSDFVPFVQRLIAERRFGSEQDVLEESLRREIQQGIDDVEAGAVFPAKEVFERIYQLIDKKEVAKKDSP